MSKIWLTSDLHFNHDKDFIWSPRGFKNIYEMNDAIIKNWNDTVDIEDDVYVLGDLMLGDNELGIKMIKQLKGKIHIILGNHDTASRKALYENCHNVVEVKYADVIKYNGYTFYLSHYPSITSNHDDDGKPLNRKVISLCGHIHTSDKWHDWNNGLIYHVEMDAHGCQVVNIEQIISDIQNKITGQEL